MDLNHKIKLSTCANKLIYQIAFQKESRKTNILKQIKLVTIIKKYLGIEERIKIVVEESIKAIKLFKAKQGKH